MVKLDRNPVNFGWRSFFVGKHHALQHIARLREALITNKPADSSWRIFFSLTRVYAASFSEKMFQYRGKEARIQRGRECLGRDRKEPVEKVLPRGMKEGVACLQRFSSETDGLPGLELGKRVCLRGFRRALNRYSITSHL